MRKLFVFMVILVLLFALGCAKKIEQSPQVAVQPAPVPSAQVNPSVEPQPAAPAGEQPSGQKTIGNRVEGTEGTGSTPPVSLPPAVEGEEGTLGSRVLGTEKAAVDESVSEGVMEISLNADKTMNASSMTVPVGTKLSWKNYDTWPHVLAVDSGKGFDTVRHGKSEQLQPGNVWEFTFNEKGAFVVRDMFSGSMRMNVTVE
jgi:plastocyanin